MLLVEKRGNVGWNCDVVGLPVLTTVLTIRVYFGRTEERFLDFTSFHGWQLRDTLKLPPAVVKKDSSRSKIFIY